MADKVDMSEVVDLAKKVQQETSSLTDVFTTMENRANAIIEMDSFTGFAAMDVQKYLDKMHLTVSESFRVLLDELDDSFESHISTFKSMVDSDDSAIVKSDYLHIDMGVNLQNHHNKMEGYTSSVARTIEDVSDLVSVSIPESHNMTDAYDEAAKTLEELKQNLNQFNNEGKGKIKKTEEMLDLIELTVKKAVKVNSKTRFTDFKAGEANAGIYNSQGGASYVYTLSGLNNTLKDINTERGNYGRGGAPKKPNLAPHPSTLSGKEKAKYVAGETFKTGPKEGFKGATGFGKGMSKALGPLSVGISGYSNYHDAKAEGLNTKQAVARTVADTAVDTAVSGAVQAGFTAAGTALIPIPGVGTAVGALVGIGINTLLNKKWGDTKKSAMDVIKKPFRKIASWFG